MANDRTLEVAFNGNFSTVYQNISASEENVDLFDDVNYSGLNYILKNGAEVGQADLFYHNTLIIPPPNLTLSLDGGIENKWGDLLDFYLIKAIMIKSLETAKSGNIIGITFSASSENYNIGPQGLRQFFEPNGFFSTGLTSGGDYADLVLTPGDGVTTMSCELFIIGTSAATNVSSGV